MISLSKVCYTICIVCIVLGTLVSIVLIWEGLNNVVAWKGLGTLAVLFCASLITLAVHSAFFATVMRPNHDDGRRARPSRGRSDAYDDDDYEPRIRNRD